MQSKLKQCASCLEMKYIWKNISGQKYCKECSYKIDKPKSTSKAKKPTGELSLFLSINKERGNKCEVTGEFLAFNVSHYAHLISKGANGSLRLKEYNIIQVCFDFHYCFDNMGKEEVLRKYPMAEWVYQKKEDIKNGLYEKDLSDKTKV